MQNIPLLSNIVPICLPTRGEQCNGLCSPVTNLELLTLAIMILSLLVVLFSVWFFFCCLLSFFGLIRMHSVKEDLVFISVWSD